MADEEIIFKNKVIIGLVEKAKINGKKNLKNVAARIDTGATKSSIDKALAKELSLGPVIKRKLVKSAHGTTLRPVIKVKVELAGKSFTAEFSIADRTHMKYRVLIGQNILKRGFIIDPSQ